MRIVPAAIGLLLLYPAVSQGQAPDPPASEGALPSHLRDRGAGTPTSMFGTYVGRGELLVYPFFEYYRDRNAEYSPQELGYGLDRDFRGDYEASEYLVFLGYGLTDNLSLELEAAASTTAELEKSGDDTTLLPQELTEAGLGDVQTQVNWTWRKETAHRPAFFSYGEIVFPFQKDKVLIGTSDWEFKLGTGAIRGFSWGTATFRAAVEYERAENAFGIGEIALEYLRRLSPTWGVFAAVEGNQDEWELIPEAQLHLSSRIFIKLNSAVGLTSKAAGWAPETGVVFRF